MTAHLTLDDIQVILHGLTDRRWWPVVGWIDPGHIGVSWPCRYKHICHAMHGFPRAELGPSINLVYKPARRSSRHPPAPPGYR